MLDPDALLLYGVADVRDRHLRFIGALDELGRLSDAGEAAFLATARTTMAEQLQVYNSQVLDVLDPVLLTQDDEEILEATRADLVGLTRDGFNTYAELLLEAFPYLPLGARPSADVGFYLARVYGMSPTRREDRRKFSLNHGRHTVWESRPFGPTYQTVATIPVPFGEALTPLRWPLLVHELAHWYLPGGEPLKGRSTEALKTEFDVEELPAALVVAFEEVFADVAAFRACGPSYIFALIKEAQLTPEQHPGRPFMPTVSQRLDLLGAEVRDLVAALTPRWDIEYAGADTNLLIRVHRVAETLLADFPGQHNRPEVVQRAQKLLAIGQPSSGVHLVGKPPVSALQKLLDARPSPPEALMNALFLAAVDTACTDSEILEAAWMNHLGSSAENCYRNLREAVEDDRHIERDIGRLAKRDTAVTGSLQAAGVHRWLNRWDTDSEKAVAAIDNIVATPLWSSVEDEDDENWIEDSPLADIQLLRRLRHPIEERRLVVRPLLDPAQIGGSTIDLRLGTEWEVLQTARFHSLDPGDTPERIRALLDASVEEFRLTTGENQDLVLHPGELLLALTLEYLRLPNDLWGNLEGRSTWARLGLQVHATAGMVDCGFEGYLTLELQNTGRLPLALSPGLRVGQMAFFGVRNIVRPYGRKETAAYSAQTKARTAFPQQHEHRALNRFLDAERRVELKRQGWKPPDEAN